MSNDMERCEAILITDDGGTVRSGKQCMAEAQHVVAGRMVCWVHKQALLGKARRSVVEFVEARK